MNPLVERFLPPAIVFGAAAYFGWPPAQPLDLGDDVVRASSVRWRPDALQDPPVVPLVRDPFAEVLIAAKQEKVESENALPVVTGPSPQELKSALNLHGIADLGGTQWAIINGQPRMVGDRFAVGGNSDLVCQVIALSQDTVTVRADQTTVTISSQDARTQESANQNTPATQIRPTDLRQTPGDSRSLKTRDAEFDDAPPPSDWVEPPLESDTIEPPSLNLTYN